VVLVAFFSGYMFLANLGAGVGCTTFLSLSLLLGMETKRAIPTSVACAGWSSLAPLLAYWVYIQVRIWIPFFIIFFFIDLFISAYSIDDAPLQKY
jgi:hypothetical protein